MILEIIKIQNFNYIKIKEYLNFMIMINYNNFSYNTDITKAIKIINNKIQGHIYSEL